MTGISLFGCLPPGNLELIVNYPANTERETLQL